MPENRIEANVEKRTEKSRLSDLTEPEITEARGGARSGQGLIAHELTHATQSGDKPKATSIGKSVDRKS